jgi:hypothetical protein
MTCIVGLVDPKLKEMWIGGDSAGVRTSGNYALRIRSDEKVFVNNDFIFGFTSSFRMGQLLRYSFMPPEKNKYLSNYQYMTTVFIDNVRQCFKRGGILRIEDDVESGGGFLVGWRGTIYSIESDFQVGVSVHNYYSMGCAEDVAMGALYALDNVRYLKMKPQNKVIAALMAAEEFNSCVRRPFRLAKLKYE